MAMATADSSWTPHNVPMRTKCAAGYITTCACRVESTSQCISVAHQQEEECITLFAAYQPSALLDAATMKLQKDGIRSRLGPPALWGGAR
jgi:hypothetical protein